LNKPTILNIYRFYTDVSGGIQILVNDILKGMTDEFKLINFLDSKGTNIKEAFQENSVDFHVINLPQPFRRIGSRRFWKYLRKFRHLVKLIKHTQCDLIHCHWLEDAFILSFLKPWHKKPVIYTCHNQITAKNFIGRYTYIRVWRRCFKRIDRIIPVSKTVEQMFLDATIQQSIEIKTIQNGVEIFPENEKKNHEIPTYVFAGRLIPHKRVHILIEAFNSFSKQNKSQFKLILAGDGNEDYIQELKETVAKNGLYDSIDFRGHTDVRKIFKEEADFYISASTIEGLPLSPLEAMSFGVYPILSNIDPHKEILQQGLGKLFKQDNVEDLVSKIAVNNLKDVRAKTHQIREHVKNNFSIDRVQREYKGLYNSILCAE
jgi:glycosyltransferase involved in cell wall biosynthesis